jgi:aminoglycoside phosphotransferase (APT) family kinase protein
VIVLGEPIGSGTRSTVYDCGEGRVAKVPFASTPDAWIRHESIYTAAVRGAGASAPDSIGVVELDGRLVAVYERVVGPSMWDCIVASPAAAAAMGQLLAELHVDIFALPPPCTLPRQGDRLAGKIRRAASVIDDNLGGALALIPTGHPMQLCHGDLHPGNVIMAEKGPVIIDWFDACRGSAIADVARSSLLMGAEGATASSLPHLPGATADLMDALHDAYMATMVERLNIDRAEFNCWLRVEAAARLAELGPAADLLAIWQAPTA